VQLLRHTIVYLLSRGVPGIVSVASLAVFTRMLAPEQYGVFVLVLATADILDAVLLQWLYWSLVRYAPNARGRETEYYSTILNAFMIALLPVALLGLIAGVFFPDTIAPRYLIIGFLYFAANGWFEVNLQRARADLKPARFAVLDITRALLSLGLAVLGLILHMGVTGLLTGYILGRVLPTLPLLGGPWRSIVPWKPDRAMTRRLLRFGLPLGVSMALVVVVNFSDRLLLGLLSGTDATGLYSAGYDLTYRGLLAVMAVVNLAGYPLITSALEEGGVQQARERLSEYFATLVSVTGLVATGYALLNNELATLMLGQEYRETGARLLPWVALGVSLSGLRAFYANFAFHLGERTELQIGVSILPAIMNIGLNLLWIPKWGPLGAVYASVLSFAAALVFSMFVGRNVFPMPYFSKHLFRSILVIGLWSSILYVTSGWGGNIGPLMLRVAAAGVAAAVFAIGMNLLGLRDSLMGRLNRAGGSNG
jgi:O-antigen/teichoic acid export membrane protein